MKLNFLAFSITPTEVNEWMRSLTSGLLKERRTKQMEPEDQLQMLLNSKSKIELNEDIIAGQALSFFTEGFETSSAALGYLIYSLAANANVQNKLYQEIKQAMERNGNSLSYDLVQQIDYLDWTVREGLRMKPPLGVMQKQATKDYILKREFDGQLEGTWIKAGTPVLIPLMAIQNDPKFFPEPEQFQPERFDPNNQSGGDRLVYFPFGEGPRMCVGMRFAQTQIKTALVRLVQRYRISVSPNHIQPFRIDARSFPVEARDGLLVRFESR